MTLTPLPSQKGNQDPEENRREAERASLMPPPVPPQELYQTQKHLSQKANESLSDPAPTKRQPKRKTRDNKGLLSVLRRHEKILQKLSESQQEDDELSELVNGLSHNMLEDALQEEKEITLQNCSKTLESLSLISQGNIYGPEGIAQTSTKQNERPILQNPTFSW